ncbi:hypothetical protein SAMN02745975_03581 [Geosporobacter subterraneus DSM 17957]|uniref:Uncharacterized protein n=1 Tax=Geosporobacter subterraneus DSM 17957 TaxID=1121919 RepID=A0A1M6PHC9_9FIRM|nr:hypothetical protein [Geosporobacter subterraneus]SHK07356.1 hypothetical protein SAMN02745975_03581 [Geosporobacter subterraneus DSM 17957]
MINHILIICSIAVVGISMAAMLIWEIKRVRRKNKVMMESVRTFNIQLAFSSVNMVFAIVFARFWYGCFQEVYKQLKPQDLKMFLQLFNDRYLDHMGQYCYEREMLLELLTVQTYRNIGTTNLMNMSVTLSAAVSGIYSFLRRNQICGDGIYARGAVIPWECISAFEWGRFWERREFQFLKPYHELKIHYHQHKRLWSKGKNVK